MLENFLTVGGQVIILFLMMAVGFFCGKKKLLDDAAVKGMTDVMLYIVTPCVIIHSFQREFDQNLLVGLGVSCLIAFLSQVGSIFLVHALIHDKEKAKECVYRFSAVFSNCGYMALPLLQAVVGSLGVFYGASYIAVFNLVLWTYGLALMSGDRSEVKAGKILANPGVFSVALGFVMFLCSFRLPDVIGTPVESFASLNTPVAMLIIGFYFTKCRLGTVIRDKKVYATMALRLVVIPGLTLLGMCAAGLNRTNPELFLSCVVSCSAPTAATTTMFAAKFHKDAALASGIVSYLTAVSIITMPVIVAIAGSVC